MAMVTPRKPISSFRRLFSVGVRTRTQVSLQWGKVLVAGRAARALSRGTHLEVREQQTDYTKERAAGNRDVQGVCFLTGKERMSPESLTAELGNKNQHGNSENDSIDRKRNKSMFADPGHEPGHRTI